MSLVDIIRSRVASGSRPRHRDDGFKIGLCIEGGGMRGVVSAGMVRAIEQLGLLPAFDHVYGASAGAMNGAYLLAGQAAFGTTIYFENINNRAFIDPWRPITGKPIVDIDFVVQDVMVRDKPLDADAVVNSPIPLSVVASDADSGRPVVLTPTSAASLRRALRAGATMAVVAGPPYSLDGSRLWDAALTEPIPVRAAQTDGCTHIVVLLTRPAGVFRPKINVFERYYVLPRMRRHSRELAERLREGRDTYQSLVESLVESDTLLPIRPLPPVVSKLERNAQRLIAAADSGSRAVFSVFRDRSVPTSPQPDRAGAGRRPHSSHRPETSAAPQTRS